MPAGSLLGPLEALLGGLKSEKMPTVQRENQFLLMQFFGSLKLLMALLGLSWSLLGGSGPKRGFQNDFKSLVKSDQKVVQKMIKKTTAQRVPKWVPENAQIEIAGLRHFLPASRFPLTFIFSFSLGFGALWVPLGSLLGLLAVLLGGLWTQKC